MRLSCGRLEQCGVRSDCLSTKFGSIKIRPVLAFTPSFLLLILSCLPLPSPPPLLPLLRTSPRTGPRRQHRSSSPVAKTRRPSSMPKRRKGVDASRSRERRNNTGKRRSDERVKRRRQGLARRQSALRRRQSGRRERRQSARCVSRRR